jgi:hypothetical protein
MTKLTPPAKPRTTTVKPPRRRQRKPTCVVCRAVLRGDHALGDLVCDCHPPSGYFPCQVPHAELDILVFTYLLRADGEPVNLYRALGCESTWENRAAIHRSIQRLNRVAAVGVKGHGYKVVTTGKRGAVRVGP